MNFKTACSMIVMYLFVSGCSLFGKQGVEMANYNVIKSQRPFEIRQY